MTDVLIPLGRGSRFDNQELRFCLRSIQQYLKGYRDIYIIGEKPAWLKNVIHIPFADKFSKERNIMEKIIAGCDSGISEEFIFFNDDHFLISSIEADKYPYYYNGNLIDWDNGKRMYDPYKEAIKNTMSTLHANERPSKHFDIHCPIIYNKKLFKMAMSSYDWNLQDGYVVKSLYCNTFSIPGVPMQELKINDQHHLYKIAELINGRHVFSVSDEGFKGALPLLNQMFPNKSIYEV